MRKYYIAVLVLLAVAILPSLTFAATIENDIARGYSVNIVKQDNFEKHMQITINRLNDTTFELSFALDPALKADLQSCAANIGLCDKQALKNRWLQNSNLTLGDIVSDIVLIDNMPIKNKTKIGRISRTSGSYLSGFSMEVEFTAIGQQVQIGQHSVIVEAATQTGGVQSDYITRTNNGTQIFAQGADATSMFVYKSLDGGISWTKYTGAFNAILACSSDNNEQIHCMKSGGHILFNMSNLTFSPTHSTLQPSGSSISRPVHLRDGTLVVLSNSGGTALKLWRSTNYGTTWINEVNFTGDLATSGDNSFDLTQTPDGFIHILKSNAGGVGYFNVSSSSWAVSAMINITPGFASSQNFIMSSPNGTVYAYAYGSTSIQWIRIDNNTKRITTNKTLQIFNATTSANEGGGFTYDTHTGFIYISFNNFTAEARGRVFLFNSTDDGESINGGNPMYVSNVISGFRSHTPGRYVWLKNNFSSIRNSTLDIIMYNGTAASYNIVYDNVTLLTVLAPPATTISILSPVQAATYFSNSVFAAFNATDSALTKFNLSAYLDGTLVFINRTYENGTLINNFSISSLVPGNHTFRVEANGTINTTLSVVFNFQPYNYFYLVNSATGLGVASWNATFTNGTTTIFQSTTNSIMIVNISSMPMNNVTIITDSFGLVTNTTNLTGVNNSVSLNQTLYMGSSTLTIFVWDEDSNMLTALNTSLQIFNATTSQNYSIVYNRTFTISSLPLGAVTLTFTFNGLIRNYYLTLTGRENVVLNVFLPNQTTPYYYTFITKSGDIFVNGTLINIQKFINGTYRTVAQGTTQIDGIAVILLEPNFLNKVTVTHPQYQTKVFDYTFSVVLASTPITILLTPLTSSTPFPNVNTFIDPNLVLIWQPNNTQLRSRTDVNMTIVDSAGLLSWVSINVTRYNLTTNQSSFVFMNLTGSQSYTQNVTLLTQGYYYFTVCAFRNSTLYCASRTYSLFTTYGIGNLTVVDVENQGGLSVTFWQILTLTMLAVCCAGAYKFMGGAGASIVGMIGFGVAGYFLVFDLLTTALLILISMIGFRLSIR